MPGESSDLVVSYIVGADRIVDGTDSGLRTALEKDYRVVSITTTAMAGNNPFVVVTVLLTKGDCQSRFTPRGDHVGG